MSGEKPKKSLERNNPKVIVSLKTQKIQRREYINIFQEHIHICACVYTDINVCTSTLNKISLFSILFFLPECHRVSSQMKASNVHPV